MQNVTKIKLKIVFAFLAMTLFFVALSNPAGKSISNSTKSTSNPFSFINFLDNKIVFKPNEQQNRRFEEIVQNAVNGLEPIRILHLGDSHVQADIFTGETRRLLALWLSDLSPARGFVFPYGLASTNNPYDFEITSNNRWRRQRIVDTQTPAKLGLSGIAISTNDRDGEIVVKLKKNIDIISEFDHIRIHYESDWDGFRFSTNRIGKEISSIDGLWEYQLNEPTDSISIFFKNKEDLTLYGFELLNTKSKVVYNAAGVNGAEVRTYLLSENLEKQLALLDPQLVIISLGTNDAYNPKFIPHIFRENLIEFVKRIKSTNQDIMVILTTPGDHLLQKQFENVALEKLQHEIYSVANELDCGVWDFYHIMGGSGSIRYWSELGLCAPDLLHLSKNGYKLQGSLFFNALVELSGFGMNSFPSQKIAEK